MEMISIRDSQGRRLHPEIAADGVRWQQSIGAISLLLTTLDGNEELRLNPGTL
jgi:hypothetical protein